MEWKTLLMEKKEHFCWIKLNRPEALNALNTQMAKDLIAAAQEVALDREIWVVGLTTTTDRAFGVGAEISAMVCEEMIDCLDAPVLRVGAPFTPVPFNPESLYLPNAQDVIQAVKKVLAY